MEVGRGEDNRTKDDGRPLRLDDGGGKMEYWNDGIEEDWNKGRGKKF